MNNPLEKVCRLYDPAFEAIPADAMLRYARSRDEADLPPLPPGASPVVFHFARLRRSQVEWVERADTDAERFSRAFRAGVVRITGGRFGDGWEAGNASDAKRLAVDTPELEAVHIAPLDEQEIGQWVYRRSVVPFDCSVVSLLLPTSLAVFDANAARYAERTRAGAPPSSAPPKEP